MSLGSNRHELGLWGLGPNVNFFFTQQQWKGTEEFHERRWQGQIYILEGTDSMPEYRECP